MGNQNSKPKPKPAKHYTSKGKGDEVKEKPEDVTSSVTPPPQVTDVVPEPEEQTEDDDVIVPECQTDSEPPNTSPSIVVADELKDTPLSNVRVMDFVVFLETALNTFLDNRRKAIEKEEEERRQKQIEDGVQFLTVEQAVGECHGFMKSVKESYDLYVNHKHTINQQQDKMDNAIAKQDDDIKKLGVIVGKIEKTQGIKIPKRPPFPSMACLTYLFWHWPMYAFAYCWLSKYFRRFCFLLAIFVMVLEFCVIVLLAGDNKTMHYAVSKYNTVRNWSLVDDDSSAMNRFNKVDLLFEDPEFNCDEIIELNDTIKSKYERWKERRRKEMERGLRR